ncbi:hypothetical protein [Clostridium akagii]|uniref:hypothetical protein n=1 Tax=Clostridium akagii TaxID=91623 RepID=UPI0004791B04|nr:hypothetical protein [Clostridium akagii]
MNYNEQVIGLWSDIDKQNWNDIHRYFDNDAVINWNNTNERFNEECETDKYFENMKILYKEIRVLERIYDGEKIRQGFVDYIVKTI